MTTHPDFKELFRLLQEKNVEYMIVGGYAVAFHGYPRFTKDVDIFYSASRENVARLRSALIAFGFEEADVPERLFTAEGGLITFGVPPSRVDLLNAIDGIAFDQAKPNAVRGTYGDVPVTFIGRDDLIKNKQATSRAQDKVDVEKLGSPERPTSLG